MTSRKRPHEEDTLPEQRDTLQDPLDLRADADLSPESGSNASPRLFGNYVLVRRLGTAGVAEIHLALRSGGEEQLVVIKWLHEGLSRHRELCAAFLREAQVAGELLHPNIVRVLNVGKHGGAYFMATEYAGEEPLAEMLRELRARGEVDIPHEAAVHIATQLARALAYAHAKSSAYGASLGVVHGAISPDNVFINPAGDVKLGEFGASGTLRLGRLAARAAYMAPEQARNEAPDRSADIFAVGVILSELLTSPRRPGSSCPPELEAIVSRAVAIDRRARYRSIGEMLADLERLARRWGSAGTVATTLLLGPVFRDREAKYQRQLQDAKAVAGSLPEPRRSPEEEAQPTQPPPPLAHTVAPPALAARYLNTPAMFGLAAALALVGFAVGRRLPRSDRNDIAPPATAPRGAEPHREAPREGRLVIESEPREASIWIEGVLVPAKTPATLEHLPLGRTLEVRLAARGFEASQTHVTLSDGRPEDHLVVPLTRASLTLRVHIDAPYAALWIDEKYHGERTVRGLSVGEDHKVAVSAPGRIGKVIYLRAEEGGERLLDLKLEPAVPIKR
jgi:hypothetical protein